MKSLVRTSLVLALGLSAGIGLAHSQQAHAGKKDHKISICHGTASAKNPYVLIRVDRSALNGHLDGTAPGHGKNNYPDFISAATGIDMDEAGLWQAATRNRTLLRAINVRRGMRRADEKPPENHWKKRFPELEAKLLDEYYKLKGWDNQGIPTKGCLHELDLDYVADDLEQRGIISDGQS